jgi:RimJ/RimL family protein N-acetyltransferase
MELYWKEAANRADIIDFVNFEKNIFAPEDCSTIFDYENWVQTKNLKIFMLTTSNSIAGTFTVFEEDNVFYMGGFAIALQYRGNRISHLLTKKLVDICGHKKIVCKTQALDKKMRKVLSKANFKHKIYSFENGRCWSWWERTPK